MSQRTGYLLTASSNYLFQLPSELSAGAIQSNPVQRNTVLCRSIWLYLATRSISASPAQAPVCVIYSFDPLGGGEPLILPTDPPVTTTSASTNLVAFRASRLLYLPDKPDNGARTPLNLDLFLFPIANPKDALYHSFPISLRMAELSTNPFRKKGLASGTIQPSIPHQAASPAAFLESITTTPDSDDPREARPIKTKVVKRVRVQSPPPLSPDSPVAARYQSDESSDDASDPFEQKFPANPDHVQGLPEAAPLVAAFRKPTDPFNPALVPREIEHDEGTAITTSAPGRGALDVNAFQRLLLTGQSGQETTSPGPADASSRPHLAGHFGGDNSTETSSTSKQPISDGADDVPPPPPSAPAHDVTPRISHEATDHESEEARRALSSQSLAAPPTQKKAPPPPSSRHGKVIRPQLNEDAALEYPSSTSPSITSPAPRSPSDVNKPLPPAPRAHGTDDEAEDIFAREAAGKVPESDGAPVPPAPSTSVGTSAARKSTPAPPPRRGHAKSDSKTVNTSQSTFAPAGFDDDAQPRSSVDSQHSRPESLVNKQAPAPPPPRRPGVAQRQSSHFGPSIASPTSPSVSEPDVSPLSFSTEQANPSLNSFTEEQSRSQPRIAPPPPPPARNPSMRRTNPRNIDGSRRNPLIREKENALPPPPPPPRQRGSSKGSMDAPSTIRRPSLDVGSGHSPLETESKQMGITEEPTVYSDEGKGVDILADLDALQREVDALRGKYGTE